MSPLHETLEYGLGEEISQLIREKRLVSVHDHYLALKELIFHSLVPKLLSQRYDHSSFPVKDDSPLRGLQILDFYLPIAKLQNNMDILVLPDGSAHSLRISETGISIRPKSLISGDGSSTPFAQELIYLSKHRFIVFSRSRPEDLTLSYHVLQSAVFPQQLQFGSFLVDKAYLWNLSHPSRGLSLEDLSRYQQDLNYMETVIGNSLPTG